MPIFAPFSRQNARAESGTGTLIVRYGIAGAQAALPPGVILVGGCLIAFYRFLIALLYTDSVVIASSQEPPAGRISLLGGCTEIFRRFFIVLLHSAFDAVSISIAME